MPEHNLLQSKRYYLWSGLSEANLICAFSSRYLGNMSLAYGDTKNALKNRKDFLGELGINYQDLVCAKQVHASSVSPAKEEDKGKGALSYDTSIADTDALVTDKRNLPLAIFTADCLSIFLYDPETPAIGLIHAGWQSTRENIVDKTLQLMQERFNTKPGNLYVGFGPAIRSCCYEVSRDFSNFFPDELIERDNRYYLDLVQMNKTRILDLGVNPVNIFDFNICTSCQNEEFFSYRREGKTCGRVMSVAMLKSAP